MESQTIHIIQLLSGPTLKHCKFVLIHNCKEIENFLLVPEAIARAAKKRMEKGRKTSESEELNILTIEDIIDKYSEERKNYLAAQLIERYKTFIRSGERGKDVTELTAVAFEQFEKAWSNKKSRMAMLPGKDALSRVNGHLQDRFGVSVSPSAIVEAMYVNEIPEEIKELISLLDAFARSADPE